MRAYGRMLKYLAAPDVGPALIHCSAGKDRTGWGATLTLTALGVDRETVTREYLLSNQALHSFTPSAEAPPEWLRPLMEVRADYIDASFAAVDEHWGGFDSYLREGLDFSEADLGRLRGNLLE